MILDVYYQVGIFSLLSIIITLVTPIVLYKSFKNDSKKAIERNVPLIIVIFVGIMIFSSIEIPKDSLVYNPINLLKYVLIPFICCVITSMNIDLFMKGKETPLCKNCGLTRDEHGDRFQRDINDCIRYDNREVGK